VWIGLSVTGASFALGVIGVLLMPRHMTLARAVLKVSVSGILVGLLIEFVSGVRL